MKKRLVLVLAVAAMIGTFATGCSGAKVKEEAEANLKELFAKK